MALLTQQALRRYEQSNLYGLIHNFQKKADDDHLIVYRHPIEEQQGEDQGMRSKNPEKNLRRQRQQQQRYNQAGNQRVTNDLGNFLGENTRQLPSPQGNNYNGYNGGYAPNNQLPSPQGQNSNGGGQQINPQPDYQIEDDPNSLNSPQFSPTQSNENTNNYFNLNNPNYYSNLNNNGNGYYGGQTKELPNVTATNEPNQVPVGQGQVQRQLPSPQQNVQQGQQQQMPQQQMPQQQQMQQPEAPRQDTVVTEPDEEQEQQPSNPTITYTDENGNTTEQEEIPIDMPNVSQDNGEEDTTDNTEESDNYSVDTTAPQDEPQVSNEDEEEAEEEADNSEEKSRIFQEIQGAINTRKWVESVQQIKLAQKANFNNMPLDHLDLVGISNGVSDNKPYRVDLDPMFFKLFQIILIGQNLDITLLARDGNSTEISIAPPDWVKTDKYKDMLIDGNYLYSYTEDLDFDKLMQTLYRFTYRPVQTKGYTELFITDLPIYPVLNKDNN